MGTWSATFDGSDSAADWFASALRGTDLDSALDDAFKYYDNFAEIRAGAYLLTVLGCSSYVWPGELDRLDGHVKTAAQMLGAMLDPSTNAGRDLVDLWGGSDAEVFDEIRSELARLKAAHSHLFK